VDKQKWTRGQKMRIKIHTKSGRWLLAKAITTSSPELFLTPERIRDLRADGKPSTRGRFSKDSWTITHRRSGYSIVFGDYTLEEASRLAELFAACSIPWEKLRSKRAAKSYSRQHRKVMEKFYRGE